MPRSYRFDVPGKPIAKGSMSAGVTNDGKAYVRDQKSKRLKEWQAAIEQVARLALRADGPIEGPVRVDLVFLMPRPKAHIRANGELKEWAPVWHTSKPDEDKLRRAVLDALTQARVYVDDAQVCDGSNRKLYAVRRPGVRVTVSAIADEVAA